jgi:multiple sugar transport system permease protein
MKVNFANIVLIIVVMIIVLPFIWLFILSIKPEYLIVTNPLSSFSPTLENYIVLFDHFGFGIALQYSTVIALLTLAISLPIASLASYGLSRFPFTGIQWVFIFLMFCRTIVPAVLVLPLFQLINLLNLRDTVWGIVLGHLAWNLPFNILLLYSFLAEVPKTIEEAAWLDGASRWTTFWRIRFPLMAPSVGVAGLFTFGTSWGEFLFAASFSTTEVRTGPVQMSLMMGQYKVWWGALAASGIFWSIPVIIMSFLFSKYMTRGLKVYL